MAEACLARMELVWEAGPGIGEWDWKGLGGRARLYYWIDKTRL